MRILVLIAIGLLLYLIFRGLLRKNKRALSLDSNKMVQCEKCRLHIIDKEAIQYEGRYFCSQKHLDMYCHHQ